MSIFALQEELHTTGTYFMQRIYNRLMLAFIVLSMLVAIHDQLALVAH